MGRKPTAGGAPLLAEVALVALVALVAQAARKATRNAVADRAGED